MKIEIEIPEGPPRGQSMAQALALAGNASEAQLDQLESLAANLKCAVRMVREQRQLITVRSEKHEPGRAAVR